MKITIKSFKESEKKWAVVDEYDTIKYFDTEQEALDYYWENGNEDYHLEIMKTDSSEFKRLYDNDDED